jgi:hypothetical protein
MGLVFPPASSCGTELNLKFIRHASNFERRECGCGAIFGTDLLTVRIDLDGQAAALVFDDGIEVASGCLLPCEEGEEMGLEFCVIWSRIFQAVWVGQFCVALLPKSPMASGFLAVCKV